MRVFQNGEISSLVSQSSSSSRRRRRVSSYALLRSDKGRFNDDSSTQTVLASLRSPLPPPRRPSMGSLLSVAASRRSLIESL